MDKRLSILTLLCLAAPCCTREVPADLPDVEPGLQTVLSADIESLLLGEERRTWPDGACIGVFGSDRGDNEKYLLRRADAGLSSALFYGPAVGGDVVAAYYPYRADYSAAAGEMNVQVDAASGQFLRYCPQAYAFLADGALKFRYPCGMLAVQLALDEDLTVLSVACSSASRALAGIGTVDADGLALADGALQEVVLSCGGGVPSRDAAGNITPFYLVLAPGCYDDLSVRIALDGEEPATFQTGRIEIPRVDASRFTLASVIVRGGGPEGFEPETVHFDE